MTSHTDPLGLTASRVPRWPSPAQYTAMVSGRDGASEVVSALNNAVAAAEWMAGGRDVSVVVAVDDPELVSSDVFSGDASEVDSGLVHLFAVGDRCFVHGVMEVLVSRHQFEVRQCPPEFSLAAVGLADLRFVDFEVLGSEPDDQTVSVVIEIGDDEEIVEVPVSLFGPGFVERWIESQPSFRLVEVTVGPMPTGDPLSWRGGAQLRLRNEFDEELVVPAGLLGESFAADLLLPADEPI